MKRHPVELAKAYLLLNHGPVTLVSAAHAGQQNIMAAAWAMPLDFQPPKVAVVIDKQTFTRTLIEASGDFVLAVPSRAFADTVLAVGSQSGRDLDKFSAYGLTTEPASRVGAPLVAGCLGWLECRVLPEPDNEARYDLFIGEVVAAWADPDAFTNGRWHFPDAGRTTIHYAAGGHFFSTGEAFDVRLDE